MPLLRFDLVAGRTREEVATLLDSAHSAVLEAFDVPAGDRYQVVHQHPAAELRVEDTGLGLDRTSGLVLLQVTSRPRPREQKERFYELLVANLARDCGTAPEDVAALLVAMAEGELDGFSGRMVRAGADDLDELRRRSQAGLGDGDRMLRLRPWGPDDPLAG